MTCRFELRRGEILGIAGLVGVGPHRVVALPVGARPGSAQARCACWPSHPARRPMRRIRAGLGLVSEDRKGEGLALAETIADNITYSRPRAVQSFGLAQPRPPPAGRARPGCRGSTSRHAAPRRRSSISPAEINRKSPLARLLHQDADVLLLDEPTRGIDVGTKSEIYRLIGLLAAEGKAVIFVSSYFTELLAVCDRVAVMARGRLREIRPAGEWTDSTILSSALGMGPSTP